MTRKCKECKATLVHHHEAISVEREVMTPEGVKSIKVAGRGLGHYKCPNGHRVRGNSKV